MFDTKYIKKGEFFECAIDALILQCEGFKLKRVSAKAMILKTKEFEALQYVNTVVFRNEFQKKQITLNSGEWETITTKRHINNKIYKYGFKLYQKNFVWYISDKNNNIIEFKDNIILKYN